MKNRNRKGRLNDRGAALVTVIVVVAFISILATTFLYLSGMNFFMKKTDQKTKESFYEAETALEEIRAELMNLSSQAAKTAYESILVQYASMDSYTRYSAYQNSFFQELKKSWDAKRDVEIPQLSYEDMIKRITAPAYQTFVGLDPEVADAGEVDLSHASEGYVLIKGICLIYTNSDGYTTIIKTDYMVRVPEINWSVGESASGVTPPPGDGSVDLSECVQYYNWVKQ